MDRYNDHDTAQPLTVSPDAAKKLLDDAGYVVGPDGIRVIQRRASPVVERGLDHERGRIMQFYPADSSVPTELQTQDLQLRVLRPEHVERDYAAFMSSRPRLLVWSGGNWPAAEFTLAQNMDDMHRHEDGFTGRTQFTYTVMNRAETQCEGCIYVDSWDVSLRGTDATPESVGAHDNEGVATYWVTDSALARDLDRQLLEGVRAWFARDFAFERVVFKVNEGQTRDIQELEAAGLGRLHTAKVTADGRNVYFYGDE